MKKINMAEIEKIEEAVRNFNNATQHLAGILEETGYTLESAPEFLEDMDDLAYDVLSTTNEELEVLEELKANLLKTIA